MDNCCFLESDVQNHKHNFKAWLDSRTELPFCYIFRHCVDSFVEGTDISFVFPKPIASK